MLDRPIRRMAALAAVSALTLAACGGDDDDSSEVTTPVVTDATPPTEAGGGDTTPESPDTTPASGEPVKIAALTSLTGNFGPWGIQLQDGMKLAVAEINAAGGAGGRPLELVVADDQSNAEEGVSQLERLIEDGVVAAGGIISSDVAVAAAQVAEESSVPLFLVKAGTPAALTAASRYTFRTCLPSAPMVAGPVLQYVEAQGLTKVGAIIADYGWGRAIEAALNDTFADTGVELQIEVAPVGETDFTTYLRSLDEFGPEIIVATGHPPGTGAIVTQSADLGLEVPITGSYTPFGLVAGGAGEAAIGRYADFKCADIDSPEYQDMAKRFFEISDNTWMSDDAVAGYGIVTAVAEAVAAVGDDPAAIAEYLHGASVESPGYAFPLTWTEWGELAEAAPILYMLAEGPAPDGVNEAGTWYPELLNRTAALEPYQP